MSRPRTKVRPKDIILQSKQHSLDPVSQGSCQEGWVDGSTVGLGCLYADINDLGDDEPSGEKDCLGFGESGRLVEIYNQEQLEFLQSMLAQIEEENQMDGNVWWWIGLNDRAEEGNFVWPSGATPGFTNWDVEYGEPYPDIEDYEYDCVEMQSAQFFSLLWMTMNCDDNLNTVPVCQLL